LAWSAVSNSRVSSRSASAATTGAVAIRIALQAAASNIHSAISRDRASRFGVRAPRTTGLLDRWPRRT